MRTRHILTALALPALFAACTADEFESANSNGLQERAKLSKNFTLVTEGSASTRYAAEGATGIDFVYNETDKIGAAIIDQYNPNKPDKPEEWDVIYSLAGNFPFKYVNENEWKADTELGIGHYLFVYPYNAKDNSRAAVKYELPVIQKMYEAEDGPQVLNAAITAGNKAVAATVLHEGETLANVNMKNLFTYPKVTINFDNGEKVTTVSQVVLKHTGGGFLVKGGYDHKLVSAMFANDATVVGSNGYWDSEKQAVDWNKVQTEDFLIASGSQGAAYGAPVKEDYLIVKFPADTKVQLDTNTKNKFVEARFMMPSTDDFSSTNIEMYVYTDNGVYKVAFNSNSCTFKSTTSDEAKKGVLNRSRSNAVTLKAMTSTNLSKVDNIVTTVADWNSLVATYGASSVDQNIAIVGDDFAFDANTKMPSKAIFTVKTAVAVKGDVTLSNVTVEGEVTVKKGAVLTTSKTFTADKIVNEGAVNIAIVKDGDGDIIEYTGITDIQNKSTLNIPATSIAGFTLTNEMDAVVENNGTITIDGTNEGTINNNGTMKTTGFVNNARKYDDANENVINNPSINNAASGKILAESGVLTNKATIVNAGVLTCKNQGGTITNSKDGQSLPAVLDSKADAITYITDNTNGKVIVYSANTEFLTIASNKGIVEYTTTTASEDFKNSLVNTVVASKSYEVKDGTLASLTLNGTATLKVGKDAVVTKVTVNKGTTTLGTDLSVTTLATAKGSMVVVPAGKTLTITGTAIDNKGTIRVGGVFNATGIAAAAGGLVEDNGSGEINWKPTSEQEALKAAKTTYENTMIAAVKAWAGVTTSGANTVDKLAFDIIKGKNSSDTAAATFEAYVNATSNVENDALEAALTAYNDLLVSDIALTQYYATAAAKIVSEQEALTAFKATVKGLTWTVTTGADHIYKDDAAGPNAKTAATKAIEAFKAAVADGTITVSGQLDKVAICSSNTNYAPVYSQVFVIDAIYKIFGTDAIRYTDDWKTNGGLLKKYNETEPASWTLTEVKGWINEVAAADASGSNLFITAGKKYITDNNLITASKSWKYADAIVAAIAAEQF